MSARRGLFAELKRRNVFRVGAAYAVVAWLLMQAADILLGNFGAPEWVFKSFTVLLMLGFPLALFLAWAYELTPDGVKRSEEVAPAESIRPITGRRIDRLIVVGLALVIGIMAIERAWFAGRPGDEIATDIGERETLLPARVAEETSIAVLPFTNMSPDPEQEFFADGITEDILTRLAGVGSLRVISRTSAMRYKGSTQSLPEIAAELGVTHILEGSVRRAGDRVRITGQLIRAADDAHLWAESFDRDLADIFGVQTEIAEQIVERLEVELTERDRKVLAHRGTENTVAYEHFLKGRASFNESFRDFAEFTALREEAERQFRAALAADPSYANAWAGLARALLWQLRAEHDPAEAAGRYEAAVQAARRAIVLAPELAAGYVELGRAYQVQGLAEAALEQFRLAAEIEPDSPDTLSALAGIYLNQGQLLKSIALLERAAMLEPEDANVYDLLAVAYRWLGEFDRARAAYRHAWERITPHEARLNCLVATVDGLAGDAERALERVERVLALEPDSPFAAACAINVMLQLREFEAAVRVMARSREILEARLPTAVSQVLAQTEHTEDLAPLLAAAERLLHEELPRAWGSSLQYELGIVAALHGEDSAALDHLELAVGLGWRRSRELALTPAWDAVRETPRFRKAEERVEADLARMRAELAAAERSP